MRRQRYLTSLANCIARQPWTFLIIGLVVAVVSVIYTYRSLDFQTSRNDLIGRDSDYWVHFGEYAKEFGSEEDYIVVVESDKPELNRQATDAIAQALLDPKNNPNPADLTNSQHFVATDLFYRVNYDDLKPWFLYYLDTNDLTQIQGSLKDFKQLVAILQHEPKLHTFFDTMKRMEEQMDGASEAQRRQMESFLPTITKIVNQIAAPQTGGSTNQFLSPWASAFFSEDMLAQAEDQMQGEGYQVFQKGKMYILLIHPRVPEQGNPEDLHAANVPKINRILADVRRQCPAVKINLTGEPVLDYDEMLTSQHDATRATLITLVLIAIIFGLGFREFLRPLMGVFCMILVTAISMGWATLSIGHLNIITVTFAVMLLGLGIDLGIQLIARFEEEFSKGVGRTQAISLAIQNTGTSIITAGLTNAAAFFAMVLSGFKGVVELGIIAGGGLVIATTLTMTVLPALVLVIHRKKEERSIPAQAAATRFERGLLQRPYAVLGLAVVVTAASLVIGSRMRFDYNVLNLQSKNLPAVETELRLLKAGSESTIYGAVVCDTLDDTRRLQNSLTGLPSVVSVHSIAELVPDNQNAKVPIIRAIQKELGDVHFAVPAPDPADVGALEHSLGALRIRTDQAVREATARNDQQSLKVLQPLSEALTKARSRVQQLDPNTAMKQVAAYEIRFYGDLEAQLNLMATQVTDHLMTINDVPPGLRKMLVGRTGKFLIRVFPKENIWERAPLRRFVREVQSVAPQVTGTPLGLYEFVEILQIGYIKAALWAFLVIAVVIALDFRGVLATLFTLLPLISGMIWMVGLMGVFNIPFNPANIMTLPLMVGIGVAYGIYVVQRYRQEGEANFYSKSTGRAVVLSALTTISAFACLILGAHQGIRSLGLVMTIGVSACLISGMVLLPACLQIAKERGWKI